MAHPIHPALVHFPVACWSLATIADIVGVFSTIPTRQFAGILLLIGSLIAILALVAGLIELAKINDDQIMKVANRHMMAGIITWLLYSTSLFLRFDGSTQLLAPNMPNIGLSIAGFISLSITGWLGGTLVYKYRVGVGQD